VIYGIGTDIVSISRIQQTLDRHGAQFAQRVLTGNELVQLSDVKEVAPWLAKRWAAKEAFGKAAGIGIRAPLALNVIGVVNNEHGKPNFELSPTINEWLRERAIVRTHLSISDEREHALAFVVFET
jgi:holo-[acyl-carrier protein] synthase